MRVSVIATAKNEEPSIGGLLHSLLAQSRQPDEVVLADGGSVDRTRAIATSYGERGLPLRLLDAPGANISRGRNLAVAAASGDIIACVDAGVRLAPEWLAELTAPFQDHSAGPAPDVVCGFFQADGRNVFEIALGATTLPDLEDVDPGTFLPSSRSVAFTRGAWERVGGYPEWLDYCEDLVFDLRLRAAGLRFAFAPGAVATSGRGPRCVPSSCNTIATPAGTARPTCGASATPSAMPPISSACPGWRLWPSSCTRSCGWSWLPAAGLPVGALSPAAAPVGSVPTGGGCTRLRWCR